MNGQHASNDAPLLPLRRPTLDDTKNELSDDELYPSMKSPWETEQSRTKSRTLLSILFGWPALVILGQALIQGLAWGFYSTVQRRKQIPLPPSMLEWTQKNPHSTTLLITLLSTFLSGVSSTLFCYALRRSIALLLSKPLSLRTLSAAAMISMRTIFLRRRAWPWSLASILVLLLTGFQTTGWTTLLTPVKISISTPIVGRELDLGNAELHSEWEASFDVQPIFLVNDFQSCAPPWDGAASYAAGGYARALNSVGNPSTITLMNVTYNASTLGILPALMEPVRINEWFLRRVHGMDISNTNDAAVPTIVNFTQQPPPGLSSFYSTVQQGASADVSCSFQNLTNTSTPSLRLVTSVEVSQWNDSISRTLLTNALGGTPMYYIEIETDCGSDNIKSYKSLSSTSQFIGSFAPAMTLVACPSKDKYTLIFLLTGIFDNFDPAEGATKTEFTCIVCTLAPKIIPVSVSYGLANNVVQTDVTRADIKVAATYQPPVGLIGWHAASALQTMLQMSQTVYQNTIVDQLFPPPGTR
ncbi:hypothetical protein MKEN_00852300 [Mycena kentingensis (nom. inval.)]|nr:hypothetical protein MKEN_00852300 [Mycena kentingensis (nom. inval.)]